MEEISTLQLHDKKFVLDILEFMIRRPICWSGNLEKGEYNEITQYCCLVDSEWGGKGQYIKFSPSRLVLTYVLNNIRNYYYKDNGYLINFLKDYYNKVNTHFIKLQNELEASEEYKMRMEQQKIQQEEEKIRRLMELEKKMEEQNIQREQLNIKKREKLPCCVCGILISRNNMSVHKKMKKCLNFGKEKQAEYDISCLDGVETTTETETTTDAPSPKASKQKATPSTETTTEENIPKDSFKCDCGMIQKKSNKTNHQNTKKCKRKRGLIE